MIGWYRYSIGVALGLLSCSGYKNHSVTNIHPYVYSDSLCQFDQTITPEEKHIDAKYFDSILNQNYQKTYLSNQNVKHVVVKHNDGEYTNKQTNIISRKCNIS